MRGFIRRYQNIANNGAAPVFDFSTQGFLPATATVTAGNTGAESTQAYLGYYTGGGCNDFALLGGSAPASLNMYGVPVALQRANDLHEVFVSTPTRSAFVQFHTMANRSVTLGGQIGAVTSTVLTGPYRRLQASFAVPADYVYAEY